MALIMALLAYRSKSSTDRETKPVTGTIAAKSDGTAPAQSVDPMDAALKLDELMLEVGVGLVPLVDANKGGQLLGKVRALRKHLATQLGFLVPSIHITDNLTIKDLEYVIHLRGVEIARWEMQA